MIEDLLDKVLEGKEGYHADELKDKQVQELQNEAIGRYWYKRAASTKDTNLNEFPWDSFFYHRYTQCGYS